MPLKNKNSNDMRMLTVRSIKLETREDKETGKCYISGFIPYDSMSENLGGFIEIIRRGAFSKSLQEADIRCLWTHDTQHVCGRSKNGTITFEDRSDGLYFEDELPKTSWASDLSESVTRGDTPGVSFGFQTVKDRWTYDEDAGTATRELLEVKLLEVSVGVAFPAYSETNSSVSTRELAQDAGINLDVIGKVLSLRKYKTDYTCSDTDAKEIRSIITNLEKLLPDKKPDEESRSTQNNKPEISTCEERERDLALLEMEADL